MSILENKCFNEIIEYYKKEFEENLKIALKPFIADLKTPIRIVLDFGDKE